MSKKRLAEFDALIGSYYGKSGTTDVETDPRKRVQDLLATYYGNPAASTRGRGQPSVSLSLGCDDGEVLSQPSYCPKTSHATNGAQKSQSVSLDFEEYVIDTCEPVAPAGPDNYTLPTKAPAPQPTAPAPTARTSPPDTSAPEPTVPASPVSSSASLTPAEADIVSDIQSIIRGQTIYKTGEGLIDRSSASSTSGRSSERSAPYAGVSNQPKSGHEIFDRIAQSMQYANAYDLGTVSLENRFKEFDRQEDQRRRASKKQNGAPQSSTTPTRTTPRAQPADLDSVQPSTADFVADLDAIKSQPPGRTYSAQTGGQTHSQPFYDTGEHVLAGNGQYEGMLRVGKGQSVPMSYGQIIAMGDLYETADDLMKADPGELNRLKTLIERSTKFYEGKKSNRSLDVSNEEWDDATKGRYLKLAEGNYEHFSPRTVAMRSAYHGSHGDNKSQWEHYHRLAIEDAQQEFLAQPPNVSIFFERALIINAFGDHFLTDAFAAGHLINKEVMIHQFRSTFFKGKDLSSAGERFFDRVADIAWKGDLAEKFSKLEAVDYPTAHVPWWVGVVPILIPIAGRDVPVPVHPPINTADRFATVLKQAATQQPERVGNLIVKALHDYLNENGVEVTNDAGDGKWILPGDGTMTAGTGSLTESDLAKNLEIMRKAVQQSINDINDPSIRADNLNFNKYFSGVWRYVPKPTSASQKQVATLIANYTDPTSSVLVQALADIATEQLNSFVKALIDAHKLQPA
jgi:hypothetical protein